MSQTVSMDKCHPISARAPVAQLVRASDQNSEDQGLNPAVWISMSFLPKKSIGKIFI